jgi:hypothetical protein
MIQLATVNRIMSVYGTELLASKTARLTALYKTQRALQHQLLSLPQWSSLDELELNCSGRFTYLVCKLTALIYSNAVLIALPANRGWHIRLSSRLKHLLEQTSCQSWRDDMSDFLLWSLFVGGLAASRSPARDFFEESLRVLLARKGLTLWSDVEAILEDFMWSSPACRHGAAVLWQSL